MFLLFPVKSVSKSLLTGIPILSTISEEKKPNEKQGSKLNLPIKIINK